MNSYMPTEHIDYAADGKRRFLEEAERTSSAAYFDYLERYIRFSKDGQVKRIGRGYDGLTAAMLNANWERDNTRLVEYEGLLTPPLTPYEVYLLD